MYNGRAISGPRSRSAPRRPSVRLATLLAIPLQSGPRNLSQKSAGFMSEITRRVNVRNNSEHVGHCRESRCKIRRSLPVMKYLSLPLFPFFRGEVLPATSSPPHLIIFSTLLCILSSSSSLPPLLAAFLTCFLTQSSHLSLGLPRFLLPCSLNSTALFGSLSSAILSTCPAHCSLLLTSLSVKLLYTPVS